MSKTRAKPKFGVSKFAGMKPFYFFKITLIEDYRVRNTQGQVLLCKNELFFLIYLFTLFRLNYTVQESLW